MNPMTAPDTRDSVERVVAEMRERLVGWDNDCDEMAKADDLAKWMDRLSAIPQQAGGEDVQRWEPSWIPDPKSGRNYFDGMMNYPEGDYVLYTDYAALQAEVARLREILWGYGDARGTVWYEKYQQLNVGAGKLLDRAETAEAALTEARELMRKAWRILDIDAPNDKTTAALEAFLTRTAKEPKE